MSIWSLAFAVDEFNLFKTDEWNIEKTKAFDGRKHLLNWIPPYITSIYSEDEREIGDAPGFYSHLPIFSEKAVVCLNHILDGNVELLPVEFGKNSLFIVNVLNVLDCIDYDKAKYKTFSDGRIMRFINYEFIKEKIDNEHIFKIVDLPIGNIFVSDYFKEIVEKNKLRGFEFSLVWSDDVNK